jgi:hypothetical protein
MKPIISTSAYWNGEVTERVNRGDSVAVGITLYPNRQNYGYKVFGTIKELAPTRAIFKKGLGREEYHEKFWKLLEDRWDEAERKLLMFGEAEKQIILLCFENVFLEGEKGFCHRTIVGEFIKEKWNQEVIELPLSARKAPTKTDKDGPKQLLLC